MKKYLAIAASIAVLGLANPFSSKASEPVKTDLVYKVEKVEKHLKEQPLGLGGVLFGDVEDVDTIRSCLILDLSSFFEKTDGMLTGVSQKGDFMYLLSGKSEIELIDYKNNGYGSVDEIFIRYDENNTVKVTNPSKEQLETANKIYELILEGYDKEVIGAQKTEEYEKSLNEYAKTNGEKLEILIEELKNSGKNQLVNNININATL